MPTLRYVHRLATILIAVFALYLGVTGTAIQLVDLRSILTGAPATNANVAAMREAFDGPGDYAVRKTADYDAAALPADFDYPAALGRLIAATRGTVGARPLDYLEFRIADGRPVAQAGIDHGYLRFDALTGRPIARVAEEPRDDQSPASTRNIVKHLHRMTTFGDWALTINLIVSVGLAVLLVTGTILYWKLYRGRRRIRRPAFFWRGGGVWRMLHRAVSIVAAAFLIVVTLSGGWLAVESAGLAISMANGPPRRPMAPGEHRPPPPTPPGMMLQAIDDARLPAMLATTLRAASATAPGDPIKVVRLRAYAIYRQGIVITGGANPRQLVFNAESGAAMGETERGYPRTPFPFGWQAHQIAKSIHRGDWFGMAGRWMDLLAGLALTYLATSGIVLYAQMWAKRRRSGRGALIWK